MKPDNDDGDDYDIIIIISCGQCYNLQYYLLNVCKYFTDHTQLNFLPGLCNLVIQIVNVSLIGSS